MEAEAHAPRIIPPSRRRDKPILSCSLCRRRKLKCDRQLPCKACVDRGLSLSCSYVRPAQAPKESKAPNSVHDRIDQLEKLVTTLMGDKDTKNLSPANSASSHMDILHQAEIPGTPDRMKLNNDETTYMDSGHWTSILDGITELREHLDHVPSPDPIPTSHYGDISEPDLLFGGQRKATKEELLAALPPRSEGIQLIEMFFGCMDASPTILHKPTFMREYNTFWTKPFDTSIMWIGLLYAVLAIGSRFQSAGDSNSFEDNAIDNEPQLLLSSARMGFYREKVVQCMLLANYLKCPPYTVETCILYFGTEFLRTVDTQYGLHVIVAMIVRIAFRMGYHRDPSKFPGVSPFWAEIRRRNWMIVMMLDLSSASQFGLPRMIQPFMYDTQEPRNLNDDEISEDTTQLPLSRPETELTQLLYSIILTRVRVAHARVMDLMNSTSQPAYKEIMELDMMLCNVFYTVPETSKAMPSFGFGPDLSSTSMRRLHLGLAFLKARLMLHRPYLILGRTDYRYQYSRKVCLNAAVEILGFQSKLDWEIQPGGRLRSAGWRLFSASWFISSLAAQDFLLATAVVVLDLEEGQVAPLEPIHGESSEGLRFTGQAPSREELIDTLRMAHRIWVKASKRSHEARRVAAAAKLVLSKLDAHDANKTNTPENLRTKPLREHAELTSPTSSFDFNNFAAEANQANVFRMENNAYSNPFELGDMPMDLGPCTKTFNWGGIPIEFQTQPYVQFPPQHSIFE